VLGEIAGSIAIGEGAGSAIKGASTFFKANTTKIFLRSEISTESNIISFTERQLQKKFKHASDFGVTGNYSPTNAAKFQTAIENFI